MSFLKRLILGGSDAAKKKSSSLSSLLKMNKKRGKDALDVDLLKEHHEHYAEDIGSGLTKGSLTNIMKNVEDGLSPGIGGKNITGTGNILTKAFNTKDGGVPGGAMMMGGLVGMAAAGASDGNIGEGALIGGLVGGGIKAIGTGIAKDIEKKFIGDLLGDSASKFSPKAGTPTGGLSVKEMREMTPDDLLGAGVKDDFDLSNLFTNSKQPFKLSDIDTDKGQVSIEALASTAGHGKLKFKPDETTFGVGTGAKATDLSIRQQQLSTIAGMGDEALKEAGSGAAFKKDFLTGQSKMNVGQMTRMSGFAGAALSGMAFSSKQRDYRRGFNKRRGNRV